MPLFTKAPTKERPLPPAAPSSPSQAADLGANGTIVMPNTTPSPIAASDIAGENRFRVGARLKAWIERLQSEPDAEADAAEDRRRRLLEHLSREVADAPDDTPIKDVVRRLNSHWDD